MVGLIRQCGRRLVWCVPNGTKMVSSSQLSTTLGVLACGTDYGVAVDATDAAGNHSGKTSTRASTRSCAGAGGGGGGSGDTASPTSPTSLTVLSAARDSVSISWGASTDAVGVTGYDVYPNGAPMGIVTGAHSPSADSSAGPPTALEWMSSMPPGRFDHRRVDIDDGGMR